jgi:hypothetical protein
VKSDNRFFVFAGIIFAQGDLRGDEIIQLLFLKNTNAISPMVLSPEPGHQEMREELKLEKHADVAARILND